MSCTLVKRVGIAYDEHYALYDFGEGHPFRGDRFANALNYFRGQRLFDRKEISIVKPIPASREDVLRVHDRAYVDRILDLSERNEPYDADTPVSKDLVRGALLIAGGGLTVGDGVINDSYERGVALGGGFHHAGRAYGGGFCLFNDVAMLIEYLRAKHGLKRFLVLDYDVHFGNGTSDLYYRDPSVLYLSLHQDPSTFYPGSGFVWQIGEDEGEGYNICVPLPPGTGNATYLHVLEETFVPLAEEYRPDIIIANGGSDSHFADNLGSLALSAKGFYRVASLIGTVADEVCDGKTVVFVGSGYNKRILPLCWYYLVAGISGLGEPAEKSEESVPEEPFGIRGSVEKTIDELKRLLRTHWACFGGYNINSTP